jgi:bromodomain-containing factor 1
MIKNALVFNQPGEPVHDAATQFKQLWEEKWRTLPAKQEARDTSEDPLGDEYFDESDGEDCKSSGSNDSRIAC